MNNLKAWIHNYENLSFEQQTEVAKVIVEKLHISQYIFMNNEQDRIKVTAFFRRILESSNNRKTIEEGEKLIERFNGLSQANKEKALKSILDVINASIEDQEQENKENACRQEGHIFSDWKYYGWTTYEKTVIDHEVCENYPVKNHKWSRSCTRCGFTESVDQEPKEVTQKREEEVRKKRIRKLENELKRLKNE